ncbi:PASTA domain-containing protein [Mycolicibacterium murale]|nr:PASTA domain-containing protein [Mycolicibacterium murale]
MKKHAAVTVAAATLLLSAQLSSASTAAAEPAPTTSAQSAATFTMPSVTGTTVAKAIDTVKAISPGTTFRFTATPIDGEPAQILSTGSWVVCRQIPGAGATFNPARTRVTFRVERPWNPC